MASRAGRIPQEAGLAGIPFVTTARGDRDAGCVTGRSGLTAEIVMFYRAGGAITGGFPRCRCDGISHMAEVVTVTWHRASRGSARIGLVG